MQQSLEQVENADIQLVGISYDDVKILKSFSESKDIGFPLLSDPGSKTIKKYGILRPMAKGLPYPGTFLIDENGTVRAKLFYEGYRKRHQAEDMIEAAQRVRESS